MSKESELLVYVLIDRKIDRYYVINLFISLSVGGSNPPVITVNTT